MQKDVNEYRDAWDQVDEPPARAPLPPEPMATNVNEREGSAMAEEFNRDVEVSPVRESVAQGRSLDAPREPMAEKPAPMAEKPAEPKTFSEAFRAARANGDKKFMWRGKSFSTALKSEKKPMAKPMEKPMEKPMAEAPAAAPAAKAPGLGMNLPAAAPAAAPEKPSMYSRSMSEDIGDAVRGRASYMADRQKQRQAQADAYKARVTGTNRDAMRGGR